MVWAVGDEIDAPALSFQQSCHLFVHVIQHIGAVETASDARLVGGDGESVAGFVKSCHRLNTAGNGVPFIYRADITAVVLVNDTVPVEDDQHGSASGRQQRDVSDS